MAEVLARNWLEPMDVVYMSFFVLVASMAMFSFAFVRASLRTKVLFAAFGTALLGSLNASVLLVE